VLQKLLALSSVLQKLLALSSVLQKLLALSSVLQMLLALLSVLQKLLAFSSVLQKLLALLNALQKLFVPSNYTLKSFKYLRNLLNLFPSPHKPSQPLHRLNFIQIFSSFHRMIALNFLRLPPPFLPLDVTLKSFLRAETTSKCK
jgi:hypothetical protein